MSAPHKTRGADRERKSHVFLSDHEIKNTSRYWFPIPFSVCFPQSLVLDAAHHEPFGVVVDNVFFFFEMTVKIVF
jgi:hypothetical protein